MAQTQGVGTQQSLGRIHMTQLRIGSNFLPFSLIVMNVVLMDLIIGLDMIQGFNCVIDLRRNVLIFGETGTEAKFLSENEIPEKFK